MIEYRSPLQINDAMIEKQMEVPMRKVLSTLSDS